MKSDDCALEAPGRATVLPGEFFCVPPAALRERPFFERMDEPSASARPFGENMMQTVVRQGNERMFLTGEVRPSGQRPGRVGLDIALTAGYCLI